MFGVSSGIYTYLCRAELFLSYISASKAIAGGLYGAHGHRMADLEVITQTFIDQQFCSFKRHWEHIWKEKSGRTSVRTKKQDLKIKDFSRTFQHLIILFQDHFIFIESALNIAMQKWVLRIQDTL